MARLKGGWNQRGRVRSLEEIGSAISFNIWQIAGQGVLDLENEGFQTGLHLAGIVQDNRQETNGAGEYRSDFLALLNDRIANYSTCQFSRSDGPSFVYLRMVGDYVSQKMGDKDNKWITGYVIDIAGDKLFKSIRRVLPGLIDPAKRVRESEGLAEEGMIVGSDYE